MKRFHNRLELDMVRECYHILRDIPEVPKHHFEGMDMVSTVIPGCIDLHSWVASGAPSPPIKDAVVGFLKEMNRRGVAHRDFHVLNVLVRDEEVFVVDLEFLVRTSAPICDSYDLTGKGMISPRRSYGSHVFKRWNLSDGRRYPSVADALAITREDFGCR